MKSVKPGAIRAAGAWTAQNAPHLERLLAEVIRELTPGKSVTIDLADIEKFDTYGAWLLERFSRDVESRGTRLEMRGLSEKNRPLFLAMQKVHKKSPQVQTGRPVSGLLMQSGRAISGFGADLRDFANLLGLLVGALSRIIRDFRRFRFTSSIYQLDRVSWQALPIVILVTLIIGAIIAQQGFFHFRSFGAQLYVIDMVGFLVTREIGVLLVAIMIAGRSGSSFTAELGSMKMREEIDALRTMGFDHIEILILPRILALVIALPLLAFVGSMSALFGAGLVAVFYEGMSPELYLDRLKDAITMTQFRVGLIQAPFFGAVVGMIACIEGLRVKGSTTSLGLHTTSSVVKSIFMVIVIDGFFAVFFASIGI